MIVVGFAVGKGEDIVHSYVMREGEVFDDSSPRKLAVCGRPIPEYVRDSDSGDKRFCAQCLAGIPAATGGRVPASAFTREALKPVLGDIQIVDTTAN